MAKENKVSPLLEEDATFSYYYKKKLVTRAIQELTDIVSEEPAVVKAACAHAGAQYAILNKRKVGLNRALVSIKRDKESWFAQQKVLIDKQLREDGNKNPTVTLINATIMANDKSGPKLKEWDEAIDELEDMIAVLTGVMNGVSMKSYGSSSLTKILTEEMHLIV